MRTIETFRAHAAQARQLAPYTSDRRTRLLLEILADQLEQKIADIECERPTDGRDARDRTRTSTL
jgi:hypothetical protein